MKFLRDVTRGKVFLWYGLIEKGAERLPALIRIVLEKAARRCRAPDQSAVFFVDASGIAPLVPAETVAVGFGPTALYLAATSVR